MLKASICADQYAMAMVGYARIRGRSNRVGAGHANPPYGPGSLAHLRGDALGADVSLFIDRPEDDLDSPDEVLRRYVANDAFDATVGGIVPVVAHHEVVAGGDAIFLGVVVEPVVDQVECLMAHPVGQSLAPLLDTDLVAILFGLDIILDLLALHRRPVDMQETVDHLDAIAGQPDDALEVVGRWILRKPEHDHVAALRLRRKD